MKRLIYTTFVWAALLLGGCVTGNGTDKQYDTIGKSIWEAVRLDLNRIHDILELVVKAEYILTLESEEEREEFIFNQFRGSEVSIDDRHIIIKSPTTYDTYYTTTILTNGATIGEAGEWQVVRTGGWGYTLTLRSTNKGIEAIFSDIRHRESRGNASLLLDYDYSGLGSAISLMYSGQLVMIDDDASKDKPLTLTATITAPITYYNTEGMTDGSMEIECYDELYDNRDVVGVDILSEPYRVALSYDIWEDEYYYDRI